MHSDQADRFRDLPTASDATIVISEIVLVDEAGVETPYVPAR